MNLKQLSIAFSFLLLTSVGQAQIFSENFNSNASLSGWTLINQDGRTPAGPVSQYTSAWILARDSSLADSCASSTSWYLPAGQADDWLISPPIQLATTSILSWDAEADDNQFPDGYEVRISTGLPTINDFNLNPPVFQINAENPAWTRRSVNLQAQGYSSQTVYLAWRNNSNDQFILNIDNISVDSITGNDAKLLTAQNIVDEFWQIPLAYADTFNFASAVENVGADTLFNLTSIYEVYRNNVMILRDSTAVISALAPADTAVLISTNNYLPTQTGDYHLRYFTTFSGTDRDSTNNFFVSDTIRISDSTYARDNGDVVGSIGIGNGTSGEIGSIFELDSADTLSSVSIYILNATGEMTGQPISLNVRSFSSVPGTIIASSDTVTYSSSGASWVHFDFSSLGGKVPLPADTFFLGVVEPDSNLSLGVASRTVTPNVNFLDFPGNPQNGWTTLDVFNLFRCLMIRPHFAPVPVVVSVSSIVDVDLTQLKVYPNPSVDGRFIIQGLDADDQNRVVVVYDINGQEVGGLSRNTQNYGADLSLNLSHLAKGVYFLRIQQQGRLSIRKLVYH